MNDDLRQRVIETLRRGEDLPAEWAHELFPPEKREYELVYYGKEREEDILASTMAVPLQPVRAFGKSIEAWQNKLILGDNLQVLKRLSEEKKAGRLLNSDGTPGVRLIYIDPPFATKQDFRGGQDEKAYSDKIAGAQFIEFLRKRLVLMRELLSDDGSIYIHLDQRKAHYVKVVMDEIFGEQNFRNEIIWRNTNSHSKAETYGITHQVIFFYSHSSRVRFNKYKRPPFKDYIKDNFEKDEEGNYFAKSDLTAEGTRNGDSGKSWMEYDPTKAGRHWAIPSFVYELIEHDIFSLEPREKLEYLYEHGMIYIPNKKGAQPRLKKPLSDDIGNYLMDLWAYQPYTQGVYEGSQEGIDEDVSWAVSKEERTKYPTQKPEGLLSRIIRTSTREGDIVLDAFAGSGTTLAVAEKLGRRWMGIDRGKLAIYTIQKRLLNLRTAPGNKGKKITAKPFVLYNAGLYDFSTLQQLPWNDWRFFALQLFECKDEPHEIGGMALHGKRKGASVLVFNQHEYPGQRVDEETIYSIHLRIGDKIGSRFFIIAPRNVFDFQQDFVDFDSVRYYALRIPYSFINELHRREFTALQQPNDELSINDLVDTEGFDFIQPPAVKWTAGIQMREDKFIGDAFIHINHFESRAQVRGNIVRGGVETFSMLLLDFDYQGDVFNLDTCYFANQLSKDNWYAKFSPDQVGKQIMAIFMDIYGNEAIETIPRDKFDLTINSELANRE